MVKERLFLVDSADGYLRASAMPIGVQTSRHAAQHHVAYTSSMDVSCIQAAEVNELYHLAHVKVNFIVWLAAFAFIKACAAFVLDEPLEHFQFTDSSSARQLASRQGSGKVRHLSGKLLWIQEKTADNTFTLRQVPTTFNVADIGTKALSRQRLFYLLYECELVFIADFSRVGANEHAIQDERRLNSQQLDDGWPESVEEQVFSC